MSRPILRACRQPKGCFVSLPTRLRQAFWLPLIVAAGTMLVFAATVRADGDSESPWLLVPTVSSNPKLGTSLGGMGAYMVLF